VDQARIAFGGPRRAFPLFLFFFFFPRWQRNLAAFANCSIFLPPWRWDKHEAMKEGGSFFKDPPTPVFFFIERVSAPFRPPFPLPFRFFFFLKDLMLASSSLSPTSVPFKSGKNTPPPPSPPFPSFFPCQLGRRAYGRWEVTPWIFPFFPSYCAAARKERMAWDFSFFPFPFPFPLPPPPQR